MKVIEKIIIKKPRNESGFVSLFTVIFFMMLITVITIGFLQIMAAEQRQSLDNDLNAGALAAAESGIEEAKRAIIEYNSFDPNSPDKAHWRSVLTSNNCNALFGDNAVRGALNLNPNGQVGQASLNQFFSCLTVNLNSPDYISHGTAGKSEFIPLKHDPSKTFDEINVSWHLLSNSVSNDGDGVPGGYSPNQLLPPVTGNGANNWSNLKYPAYLRVELYGFPNGSFSRSDIDKRSHAVVLAPSTSGLDQNGQIQMDTIDPRGIDQAKPGVQQVKCKGLSPVPIGNYACSVNLILPSDPSLRGNNNNYYLRVTPIYGSTHFRLQLLDSSSGGVVNFSEVQPTIDSTGRTKDVFRRVQARVLLTAAGEIPEYVVESVNDICKDMTVSDGSYYQNNCPALP